VEVKQGGKYKNKGTRDSDFKHSEVDWSKLKVTQVEDVPMTDPRWM